MDNNINRAREVLAEPEKQRSGEYDEYCRACVRAERLEHAIAGPALELAEAVDKEPFTTVRLQNALEAFLAALDRALEADRG